MRKKIDLNKAAGFAVIINSIQIAMAALIGLMVVFGGDDVLNGVLEQAVVGIMAAIVVWGAVVDIREAFFARQIVSESNMLEEAYAQLEALNGTLRAQRHDFMNHLQVVFSLIEMEETQEAQEYIERVYGDIQLVGRALKTAIPAVNALVAAKLNDMDEAGVKATLTITSPWRNLPVPGWEMCRVLGNLIDNAMDAARAAQAPEISLSLSEDLAGYRFQIENNGGEIAPSLREKIFQAGFSTKSAGRGMGLSIVKDILERYGGAISVEGEQGKTRFLGRIPKAQG